MDSCFRGDDWWVPMAGFGSFIRHHPFFYAELLVVCERLELAAQLGYFVLEVESNSVTIVSWILSGGPVCWDCANSLSKVCALTFSPTIFVRHVLHEAIFATDFLANWACTHRVSQRFLHVHDFPMSLSSIVHLDA